MIRDNFERGYEPSTNNLANPEYPKPAKEPTRRGDGERVIVIRKEQILYDVEAGLGLVAKMRRNDVGVDAPIGTDDADKYRPLFERWTNIYLNKAKDRMRAYIVEPHYQRGVDTIQNWEEQRIRLNMPDYWDDRVWATLVDAVHNYIVYSVLYDYLKLTVGEGDVLTVTMLRNAMSAEKDIKYCVSATKAGSVRKSMNPFPK